MEAPYFIFKCISVGVNKVLFLLLLLQGPKLICGPKQISREIFRIKVVNNPLGCDGEEAKGKRVVIQVTPKDGKCLLT